MSRDLYAIARAQQQKAFDAMRGIGIPDDAQVAERLAQGFASDFMGVSDVALSGGAAGFDLLQLGLKSSTARTIGRFLESAITEDTENPPSPLQDITNAVTETQKAMAAMDNLMQKMLSIVDEVANAQLPEMPLDPFEMAGIGIPGVSLSDLESIFGGA